MIQVLQEPPKSGSVLMEEDYQLLSRAESGKCGPTLRFYTWDVPTVSLGHHQCEDVLDLERLRAFEMPWVRRPTGGAAVLHSEELTYSVIFPWGSDAAGSRRLQELVSRAIADGLRKSGIPADVDPRGEPLEALTQRASCFVRTSRWEVTVSGRKMVGSAQRKLARAILQHGSILLGPDHQRIVDVLRVESEATRAKLRERLVEHSISASEVLGRVVTASEVRETLAESFVEVLAGFAKEELEMTTSIRTSA